MNNLERVNPWIFKKTEDLLKENLASEISKRFWINKESAKRLIESKTQYSLNDLKSELNKLQKKDFEISDSELEKLFFTIKWAKEIIFQESQREVSELKDYLEKEWLDLVRIWENILYSMFPKKFIDTAKNPKYIHEHFSWMVLWSAETILTIVDVLYNIWKWILKTPYDIYLIVSWKWKFEWFDKV